MIIRWKIINTFTGRNLRTTKNIKYEVQIVATIKENEEL